MKTGLIPGRRTRSRLGRMAGGECHMIIGLCEVNWGGCLEGEGSMQLVEVDLCNNPTTED